MKISETSKIAAVQADGIDPPRETRAAAERVPDRVTTEQTAKVAAAIAAACQSASAGRAARLRSIETAVKAGTYRPDPQHIAEQILDEAEIAVRLQAMLRK